MISFSSNTGIANYEQKSVRLICPHCGDSTSPIIVSIPSFSQMVKYGLNKAGLVFACTTCKKPIYLEYAYNLASNQASLSEGPLYILKPKIDFDFEFIPESVAEDFKESLECYRHGAFNAFGAMCRRTIQETASNIGAKDSKKIQHQIQNMKEMADIDDETFKIISQIILDGHDGAHPHLPDLSQERAEILLELMKDVMYQLYIRKGKVAKAAAMRKAKIEENRSKKE